MRIAALPGVLYAPQYIAEANGYFAQRGLAVDISVLAPGGYRDLVAALDGTRADVIVGNLWFALRPPPRRGGRLVWVAGCNQTCRYVIVERAQQHRSRASGWRRLVHRTLLVPAEMPTAWAALRGSLARAGIDMSDVNILPLGAARDALAEFNDGLGDFLLTDVERATTEQLVEVVALADVLGRVPWSVYLCSETTSRSKAIDLRLFREAIDASLAWIGSQPSDAIVDVLEAHNRLFGLTPECARVVVGRYRAMGLWGVDSSLDQSAVNRWRECLVTTGLLPRRHSRRAVPTALGNEVEQ